MIVYTYDLNREEEDLNNALEAFSTDIKEVQFLDNKAIVILKDEFILEEYIETQKAEAQDALAKKEYELALLESYTHIEEDKIKGAIDGTKTEIKTLKAKIKTSEEWLKKTSSKK